jgi:hypothetical protein
MTESKKCAHPSCACQAGEKSDYCGPFCEAAAKTADVTCGCQHSACAAAASEALSSVHEQREKALDKTLADSYPASDPPSTIPDPAEEAA